MINKKILLRILDNNGLFTKDVSFPLEVFEKEDPYGLPVFVFANEKELDEAIKNNSFVLQKV